MKKLLFIDACVREKSRTRLLANSLLKEAKDNVEIIHLKLTEMDLKPLINDDFIEREELLNAQNFDHPRFKHAHQISEVDYVVIAAPFWDLSFPSIVKIYIENCSVDGITFKSNEEGLEGLCKASNLIYLTTRGGLYENDPADQGTSYLKHISDFFGIENFTSIGADGMDIEGFDSKGSLKEAKNQAEKLGKELFNN